MLDLVALKIRPSKRSHSPVWPSVKRIFSTDALEATQLGSAIASSAASTPGTGRSSFSKAANIASR